MISVETSEICHKRGECSQNLIQYLPSTNLRSRVVKAQLAKNKNQKLGQKILKLRTYFSTYPLLNFLHVY